MGVNYYEPQQPFSENIPAHSKASGDWGQVIIAEIKCGLIGSRALTVAMLRYSEYLGKYQSLHCGITILPGVDSCKQCAYLPRAIEIVPRKPDP